MRTVYGRNGPFSVGTLSLDLGEFVVKDKRLEQFDDGEYEGHFTLAHIGPSCYLSNGRMVVELRAKLFDFRLDVQGPIDEAADIEVAEPDDDEPESKASPAVESPAQPEATVTETPSPVVVEEEGDDEAADATLFGPLWPAIRDAKPGDRVKLDSSTPRPRLKQQVARIGPNGLGWTFDFTPQEWVKPTHH
ncbi:DUF3275 family protein [Endothiovibrio diazotrophicus]